MRAAARCTETFRVFDEIWIGQVAGYQAIAEIFLLDAADIAKSAINKNDGDQRNAVPDRGGKLVACVQKSAVAIDRQNRHIRPCVLRAKRGRIAPTEIILIAGRKKCAGSVDGQCKACGKSDLRDLVDKNSVFGKFGADRLEEGQLWRELGKTLPQLGLTAQHFIATRRTAEIEFCELIDQRTQNRSGITDERYFRLVDPRGLVRVGVDAHDLQRLVHAPLSSSD